MTKPMWLRMHLTGCYSVDAVVVSTVQVKKKKLQTKSMWEAYLTYTTEIRVTKTSMSITITLVEVTDSYIKPEYHFSLLKTLIDQKS